LLETLIDSLPAARLQGIAATNTLVISAATLPLLGGFFACQSLGTPLLKGFAQSLAVYQVRYESTARSRLEAAGRTGLTPLVGREQEVGLLVERWVQVKDGLGQVVLLSGEAGIGKSRLVQVLTEQVATEPHAWLTPCQCSPYHQHSALYPLIDLLERVVLQFDREESPQQKLRKLARGIEVVGQRETEGRGHRNAPLRGAPHESSSATAAVRRCRASLVFRKVMSPRAWGRRAGGTHACQGSSVDLVRAGLSEVATYTILHTGRKLPVWLDASCEDRLRRDWMRGGGLLRGDTRGRGWDRSPQGNTESVVRSRNTPPCGSILASRRPPTTASRCVCLWRSWRG
jgi:hypothetical protein